MFGSHLSIAGGLYKALLKAEDYGFETLQVFTKSQQQWAAKPLGDQDIVLWKEHARRLKYQTTLCHNSYLINVGSPNPDLWQKSLDALIEEHRRCDLLGINLLVMHPGAHCGSDEQQCLDRIARAINLVHQTLPDSQVMTTLEITAGQGTCMGHRFEHLGQIMSMVKEQKRVGVCLDTAHLFAAGYDFRGQLYPAFRAELDKTIGLRRVKAWHLNDSKKVLGSRVDRHDHIGEGKIGPEGFAPIINDPLWDKIPKILETPKETAADGRDWDSINLERLLSLRQNGR